MRLFDLDAILLKGGAFELRAFKTMLSQRLEKAHEKLMTTWYPAVLQIFYQGSKRNDWSKISPDRIQVFFRLVSFILADQLRSLVRSSLEDFCALFDGVIGTCTRMIPNSQPVTFIVRAVLEETSLRLEPGMPEVKSTVESFIDQIISAVDHIPKIETQLFSNAANISTSTKSGIAILKPEHCINVAFEVTFPKIVKKCRSELSVNLTRQLGHPSRYLAEYDKHKQLIDKTVYNDVTEFLEQEQTQDKMMEEVKRWRNLANISIISAYPFVVWFSLIELHCDELIKDLADRASSQANRILERLALENRTGCQRFALTNLPVFAKLSRKYLIEF